MSMNLVSLSVCLMQVFRPLTFVNILGLPKNVFEVYHRMLDIEDDVCIIYLLLYMDKKIPLRYGLSEKSFAVRFIHVTLFET